jgi:PAS domain S-box-containing protein
LLGVWAIWQPAFGIRALTTVFAALAGAALVVVVWTLLPKLRSIPTARELAAVNGALEAETAERRALEVELRQTQTVAEARLNKRTAEMTALNLDLARQVAQFEKTAHKLAETTDQFMDLADRTRTGIVHVTPDGVVRSASLRYAELVGVENPHELIGRNVDEWVIEPDGEAMRAYRRSVLLGNHVPIEKRIRRTDGTVIDVEKLAALSRAEGETIIVGFVRDITKRKAMEREAERVREQLAHSNQDLERFASIASHDLNAPLRHLRIALETVMEDAGGALDADCQQMLEQGHQAALRMSGLVRDLLDFSRIDAMASTMDEVNLAGVIRGTLETIGAQVSASGATVEIGDLPTLRGNASALAHLWQNLIGNAIAYRSEKPPEIEISAADTGDGWEIAIADNGIGVPPDQADRIFEMHARLHAYKDIPGTGIGLAACRRIAELHGGHIWLDTAYTAGARFVVWLPKRPPGSGADHPVVDRRQQAGAPQQWTH